MKRVLLAEDEALVRAMAEEDLTEIGCAVTVAESGDAAIALVRDGLVFDILVTDIRMPGSVDGWELARRVRDRFPTAGIVYVSGFPGDGPDPLPGSHFIKKPYRIEQLRQAIAQSAP